MTIRGLQPHCEIRPGLPDAEIDLYLGNKRNVSVRFEINLGVPGLSSISEYLTNLD